MMIFLVAINTCGWRAAGVNHVLIFELNPRTHLTYQQVLEVGMLEVYNELSIRSESGIKQADNHVSFMSKIT